MALSLGIEKRFGVEPLSNERDRRRPDEPVTRGLRVMHGRPVSLSVVRDASLESCHEQAEYRDHPFHHTRRAARRQGGRVAARARGTAPTNGIDARRSARLSVTVLRRADITVVDGAEERDRTALE